MWREDDFEDKGKRIKFVPRDKGAELINGPDLEPEGKTEGSDERVQESSHSLPRA